VTHEPGDADLLLVRQDALLVDAVALRADLSTFAGDPLAALLAALAADVDADGPPLPRAVPTPAAPRRRLVLAGGQTRRGTVVALTAAALLATSSGVAAAVTGDPLAVIRQAARAVTGSVAEPEAGDAGPTSSTGPGAPADRAPGTDRDGAAELPDDAAAEAAVNHGLVRVGALLAHGDLDRARALLAAAEAQLAADGDVAVGLQQRLRALSERIDRAQAQANEPGATTAHGDGKGQPGGARTSDPVPADQTQAKPKDAKEQGATDRAQQHAGPGNGHDQESEGRG
jgi:hypothetical protein